MTPSSSPSTERRLYNTASIVCTVAGKPERWALSIEQPYSADLAELYDAVQTAADAAGYFHDSVTDVQIRLSRPHLEETEHVDV